MKIVKEKISLAELQTMAEKTFGDLVKAVVDVAKGIMAVDGEEALLLAESSKQENLWGINLYPKIAGDDWLEFDSMINLRPSSGNRSRGVDDLAMREKIKQVVNQLIER